MARTQISSFLLFFLILSYLLLFLSMNTTRMFIKNSDETKIKQGNK